MCVSIVWEIDLKLPFYPTGTKIALLLGLKKLLVNQIILKSVTK